MSKTRLSADCQCGIRFIDADEIRDDEVPQKMFLSSLKNLPEDETMSAWVDDTIVSELADEYGIRG